MTTNEEWSHERGYSVPPPAETRNIVNTPMKFGPARLNTDDIPDSQAPEELPNKGSDEESETAPKVEAISILSDTPTPDQTVGTPMPKFLNKQQVKIEWQGCQFNVTFDDVWTQADPNNPDEAKWLILVHDLDQHAGGPPWTPPISSDESELATITIHHNSVAYTCSYFGLDLMVPTCNLSLTTFLIVSS